MSSDDTPAQPAKSRFSIPKMPSMSNLMGSGNTSEHDCMIPPPTLQRVPDMDANTAQFYETTKQKLDSIIIQPYIDLGDNIPHILADGFEQFFKDNKKYQEMICQNIGDSVQRSMGYVVRSNGSEFQKGLMKGGNTCDGNPPFDWHSLIPGMPNFSYTLKKQEEEKSDDKKIQEQIKSVGQAISELILPRFSKNTGVTYSDINAYNTHLLDYIYRQYNDSRPFTSSVRNIINSEINKFLSDAINAFISSINQTGGAPEGEGEAPAGNEPVQPAPAGKKPGFFSKFGSTLKNKAAEKLNSVTQGVNSLKDKASEKIQNLANAAKEFKKKPFSSMANFAKSTFMPKDTVECAAKHEEILSYKPDTYDMEKITSDADKYVGQNINSILCKHKETLTPLCENIVLYYLSEYLKDVSPGSPVFESTKTAYINSIGVFCENIPEDIAFKMIYKYLFETDLDNFMTILSSDLFKIENIIIKYEPFANIDFKFESAKTVTPLAEKPNIRKPLADSSELRYTFSPAELNNSNNDVVSQTTSAVGHMLLGNSIQFTYGDAKALPRLVFKYLAETVDIAIKNKETLPKIYKLFDDAVYRSVDAINNQLKNEKNLTTIMCKYLISTRSRTKELIESAINTYDRLLFAINHYNFTTKSLTNLMGFYIYHTLHHTINPKLKSTDINTIYSEYAKKVDLKYKDWNNNPLQLLFNKYDTFPKELMKIVGKKFEGSVDLSEFYGGKPKKRTRRFRKNKKRKSRKYKTGVSRNNARH
jgi:hypothetical protein